MTQLKIFKTNPNNTIPRKQTSGSSCFDLTFQSNGKSKYTGFTRMNKPFSRQLNGQIVMSPGDRVMVPTGVIMDIPEGHSVRVHARSGLSLKQGLVLANAEGVIDSDYVEEVMVLLHNISENSLTISSGDRIAQAELIKDAEYTVEESATRPGVKTTRVGGMGSTGIKTIGETITITVADPPPTLLTQTVEKKGRGRPKKNVSAS